MGNSKKFHQKSQNYDRGQHHGGMRDNFDRIAAEGLLVRRTNGDHRPYKAVSSWKGDGIDHINIDFYGETELGRSLDFSNKMPFRHHIFDTFNTIDGFRHYICSEERDDALRFAVGRVLKEYSRRMTQIKIKHIRAIVMDTAYRRIKDTPSISQKMYQNELPFDSYRYTDKGVPIRHRDHDWIVEGYMEIQRAIHANTEPDFSFLYDPGETPTDIYETVRPVIPESVRRRLAERDRRRLERQTTTETVTEKPQKAATVKQEKVKPPRDEFSYDKNSGHCLLVPSISHLTEPMFLSVFRRTVKINGIAVETGPVVSNVELPLLAISDHQTLDMEGLIAPTDVVRAGPVEERTFKDFYKSQNVIQLDTFVFRAEDDSYVSVPLWLKLVNRSFSRRGDEQVVEVSETNLRIKRSMTLYKKIHTITSSSGADVVPACVTNALALVADRDDLAKFNYVMFTLDFVLELSIPTKGSFEEPLMFIKGTLHPTGISTGPHDDQHKHVVESTSEVEAPYYEIEGVTFTLYRGQLVDTSEIVATEANVVVDEESLQLIVPDDSQSTAAEPLVVPEEGDNVNQGIDDEIDAEIDVEVLSTEDLDVALEISTESATEDLS